MFWRMGQVILWHSTRANVHVSVNIALWAILNKKVTKNIVNFLPTLKFSNIFCPFLIQNGLLCIAWDIRLANLAAELAYFDTSWVETCSTLESLDDVKWWLKGLSLTILHDAVLWLLPNPDDDGGSVHI